MRPGHRIQRKKPLKAKVAMKRDKALRAKPKQALAPSEKELNRKAQLAFYKGGLERAERDGYRHYVCPVCRDSFRANRMQVHHVITQEQIRRYIASLRLYSDELEATARRLLWDVRNALALCTDCHARHTTAVFRIPRHLVPERAVEFAREIEAEYLLDRYYQLPAGR